jgi:mono/diheme cytochrome c family protein
MKTQFTLVVLSLCLLTGCREERPVAFEPNLVHTHKYEVKEGFSMTQASEDTTWVINQMFGTPDDPKLPEVITSDDSLKSVVSMDNLKLAAGAPTADGHGLYRKHCADCHGITGNGRGPTAAIINPYPRDYRPGIFKFKTTERGSKPAREDLARSIRLGIAGTAMKPIEGLTEDGVQALTDYVIYLSLRGETERAIVDGAIFDLDLEGGDRIIDPALKDAAEEDEKAKFTESWEIIEDTVAGIAEAWLEAEDSVIEIPEAPADIPVANNHAEFVKLASGPEADTVAKSVARGRELFKGKVASCSKCHGEDGLGNGQTTDYDDWTKDWTVRMGLDPLNREPLVPLLARGALPPQTIHPRNFAEGYFRGGDSAKDLWLRITQGIEGTPMPAATFVEGEYEEDDVWHLINFIRSLQKVETVEPPPVVDSTKAASLGAPADPSKRAAIAMAR